MVHQNLDLTINHYFYLSCHEINQYFDLETHKLLQLHVLLLVNSCFNIYGFLSIIVLNYCFHLKICHINPDTMFEITIWLKADGSPFLMLVYFVCCSYLFAQLVH